MSDPKSKYYNDKFPEQEQDVPGTETAMEPEADHGEESYQGTGKLKDKKIIITGADSGIGRAVAIAFAREGADLLLSYLHEDEDAEETASYVKDAGRKAILMPGHIGEEEHCKKIINRAVDEFGQIDILVNNAAFQMNRESLEDIPSEEWDYTFKTNIYSMFYLCKAAVPHMKPGSAIINTTSVNAYTPKPTLVAYAATKAAVQNFTTTTAQLLAEKGIRVNCVAPGPVWTPLIPSTFPAEQVSQFGQNTPMGRAGQPAEMAPTYVLLASGDSSYMSGATVELTGGMPTI